MPLQDPYANFVIQTALTVTSGPLHMELVEAIRPFLPSLRGTPFGKVTCPRLYFTRALYLCLPAPNLFPIG